MENTNVKANKLWFLNFDHDQLLCNIDDYFYRHKIKINSQLMDKAIRLAKLYGYFYYLAIKIDGEYNVVHITDDKIKLDDNEIYGKSERITELSNIITINYDYDKFVEITNKYRGDYFFAYSKPLNSYIYSIDDLMLIQEKLDDIEHTFRFDYERLINKISQKTDYVIIHE